MTERDAASNRPRLEAEQRGDRIAILGDLHGKWNACDNEYFDSADYDLLIFVGDLGSGTLKDGLQVIRQLSKLRVPALVLPGNNDAEHLAQLQAELALQAGKLDLMRMAGLSRRKGASPCGYSAHPLVTKSGDATLIAGRPCAMGGSEFSFGEQIARVYGVSELDASTFRLKALVDAAETDDLIFLAHNGPFGLGEGPTDIWGRDFSLESPALAAAPKDWGDKDLQLAVDYARSRGKRVLAVIAGHMHRSPFRESRPLMQVREETVYLNAAVVPRIRSGKAGELHHHIELNLDLAAAELDRRVSVTEHWLELPGA